MELTMITQEMLKNLKPKQYISGVLLVKNYDIQLTKQGKEYIVGNLQSGVSISFKAWGNSSAFTSMKNNDFSNCPAYITGSVDDYGGVSSIILDSVQAVEGFTPDQFFSIKYNMDAYWDALKKRISSSCSEKAYAIADKILFSNEEVAKRFKEEFAASSHHDNCKSGLLAHTYKVLSIVANIVEMCPSITVRNGERDTDLVDLLYIGSLLHDIGKIKEMNFGVYQPTSFATHRFFGVEYIDSAKEDIITSYGEDWYYQLVSIILQHHGEYGEPCKTVASYIVHKADEMDASVTLLAQKIEAVDNVAGTSIRLDSNYLTV